MLRSEWGLAPPLRVACVSFAPMVACDMKDPTAAGFTFVLGGAD